MFLNTTSTLSRMVSKISRLEFIRLLGFSALGIAIGGFSYKLASQSNIRVGSPSSSFPFNMASGQSVQPWVLGPNTSSVPIHSSLLPNGKIMYIAGSGYHSGFRTGPFQAQIFDPVSGAETNIPLQEDLFCAGHVHLANGNILFAGGTLQYDTDPANCNGKWHGLSATYEFDITTNKLIKRQSMEAGRWYPTLVILTDGKVSAINGFDDYGVNNRLIEIYDPSTKSWTIKYDPSTNSRYCVGEGQTTCQGSGTRCYGNTASGVAPLQTGTYPRMHLMPSGLVVTAGMYEKVRSFDANTGRWVQLANTMAYRHYGTSVLLPLNNNSSEKGKILVCCGSTPDAASSSTSVTEIIDFNASSNSVPVIRTVVAMNIARKYANPVILPNGKVVIFGGVSQGSTSYRYQPEMFDPVTESWTLLEAATVPRSYHGVALLLLDGSVWTASSTPLRDTWELRTEIYRPAYYFASDRPTISGNPVVGSYNETITIPTENPSSITRASLLRLQSATHHYDPNQRLVWLAVVGSSSDSVTVSAPINANIAPPGYYMICILNSSNVPSIGKVIKMPGVVDSKPPGKVNGLVATAATQNQINLSWNPNPEPDLDHYNIHRSITSGFTADDTTKISQTTSTSFSDTGLLSGTKYYYKVRAVDNSTNIGEPSDQKSATTTGTDTTIPSVYITSPAPNASLPPGAVAVTGTASDNQGGSGLNLVDLRVDSGAFSPVTPVAPGDWSTWTKTVTITQLGTRKIQARATDNAGNRNWWHVYVNIT